MKLEKAEFKNIERIVAISNSAFDTIDFIGLWETLNNDNFNRIEFDAFKKESGKNSFVMTPTKWISKTNAIGFRTKAGTYVFYVKYNDELSDTLYVSIDNNDYSYNSYDFKPGKYVLKFASKGSIYGGSIVQVKNVYLGDLE